MLKKLLIKVIKKSSYVQELEARVKQLKEIETRLREEKSDMVIEKNRTALRLKYLENALIDMIENPHMIFEDVEGKFISIDPDVLDKNENKHITCVHTFPVNRIVIRVKEGEKEMIDEKRVIKKLEERIDTFVKNHPEEKNCKSVQVQREFIHMLKLETKKQNNN